MQHKHTIISNISIFQDILNVNRRQIMTSKVDPRTERVKTL